MIEAKDITVSGVTYALDGKQQMVVVTFQIGSGLDMITWPVSMVRDYFDEADYIKAARADLHRALVEMTAAAEKWHLDDEAFQAMAQPKYRKPADAG